MSHKDHRDPIPFELVNPPSTSKGAGVFTYVIETNWKETKTNPRPRPVFKKNLNELKGPIKFMGNDDSESFVACNIEENGDFLIYIFSTKNWNFQNLNVHKFANLLRGISQPRTQMKIFKSVLLKDYFVFVEKV